MWNTFNRGAGSCRPCGQTFIAQREEHETNDDCGGHHGFAALTWLQRVKRSENRPVVHGTSGGTPGTGKYLHGQSRAIEGRSQLHKRHAVSHQKFRGQRQRLETAWPTIRRIMECINHPGMAAAGSCQICGKALCASCMNRFNPPLCESCLLSHNSCGRGGGECLFFECCVARSSRTLAHVLQNKA